MAGLENRPFSVLNSLDANTNFSLPGNGTSSQDLDLMETQPLYRTTLVVWKVCSPPILLLGIAGNSLTLATLTTLPPGALTPSLTVYMTALAVSDTLLLLSGLLRRLVQFFARVDVRLLHDVICRGDVFLVYLSAMTSSWLLVAMTLQRAVSGMCPRRFDDLASRQKARVMLGSILIALTSLNLPLLVGSSLHPDPDPHRHVMVCDISPTATPRLQHFLTFVFPWIDLTLTSVLPSVLLLLANVGLAFTLVKSSRRLVQHAAQTGACSGSRDVGTRRAKAASALTVRLICLSVTFLCLTSPVLIVILVELYHQHLVQADAFVTARWGLVTAVCHLLWYTNSAINFYLYCMTSGQFRAQCRRLMTCRAGRCR